MMESMKEKMKVKEVSWIEEENDKKRVSLHNVGNLIQMMWDFDNMEEPLIGGTQFDKGAI